MITTNIIEAKRLDDPDCRTYYTVDAFKEWINDWGSCYTKPTEDSKVINQCEDGFGYAIETLDRYCPIMGRKPITPVPNAKGEIEEYQWYEFSYINLITHMFLNK